MKKKAGGQSKNNINISYFKMLEGELYAREKLDLLFHFPFSPLHPFQENAKPQVSGCMCFLAYINIEEAFRWLK
jgi:hypothetical protein